MDISFRQLAVFISLFLVCNSSVISIGLHVAPTINSQSTDITTITLYWQNDKIICQFMPSSYDKWFHCNTSTFISYQNNCQSTQHTLIISIPINDGLWIDQIEVYDHNNTRYQYHTFCSSLTFPFWQPTNTNCSNYQLPAWNIFCIGYHCNNYTSLSIDLSYVGETSITQSNSTSDNLCTNMNPSTTTETPPKLGVTQPQRPMPSLTSKVDQGVVFETTTTSTKNAVDVISINNGKHNSINFMSVLLPALLITICVCFLCVVCFLICTKRKQSRKRRDMKSSETKRAEMEMHPQSTCNKSQQQLISDRLNRNDINISTKITLVESSDSEIYQSPKTNSKMEGTGYGDLLERNFKKPHKATFDSLLVGQYSLPASPMQSPQRKPVEQMPVIIGSDEESNNSSESSLYLEHKKNEDIELKIQLGLKDLGNTKGGGGTPGDTPGGDTPGTPDNDK